MKKSHAPVLLSALVALVAWWGCAIALAQSPTPATLTAIPAWENLIATTPFAGITLFIVKWLLSHLDALRTQQKELIVAFLAELTKKDEAFAALAERCHKQLEDYGVRLSEVVREMISENAKEK